MRYAACLFAATLSIGVLAPVYAVPLTGPATRLTQADLGDVALGASQLARTIQALDTASELLGTADSPALQALWYQTVVCSDTLRHSLEPSERSTMRGDAIIDAPSFAAQFLGRLHGNAQLTQISVRGWDMTRKQTEAKIIRLAAIPTPAGAQDSLVAILVGLLREAQGASADTAVLEQLQYALLLAASDPLFSN